MTKLEEINLYGVSNEPTKITEKAMRTEQEILKDFSKIGWKVVTNNASCMVLFNLKKGARIFIYYKSKKISFFDKVDFKVFKLLHELFKCWGWI